MARKYPGVRQRSANTFEISLSDGYMDEHGKKKQKRHYKTVTAKSAKEASDLRAKWITEVSGGMVLSNARMTLNDFYDYFKEHSERLAPKTILAYDGVFFRIGAALGHKKLDDISPNHIRSFIKNLEEPGIYQGTRKGQQHLSGNMIHKHHTLLNLLFNRAVKWGLAETNPCKRTDAPSFDTEEQVIYNEEQTGNFLLLLESEPIKYRAMIMITLSTGCRRGETMGLQWKHIDFDAGTLKIDQTAQYIPGQGVFTKDPKTKSSKRTVSLPRPILDILKKHKTTQIAHRLNLGSRWVGADNAEDDFVFTTWEGKQMHPDTVNTWLRKFVQRHNLPPLSPKGFRHMAATFLITSGTDIRTVAGKLGHANTTTTTVVYAHLLKSAEKETADKMEYFLQQATNKAKAQQKKQAE